MAHEIFMPKLSSTMAVGSITEWYKEEGDPVEAGEAIFEVMTDKIAIEVEAYDSGVLLKKYYGTDEPVPVNQIIGYIGEAGEEVPDQPPGTEGVDKDPAIDSSIEAPLAPEPVVKAAEAEGQAQSPGPTIANWGEPMQPEQVQASPPSPEEPFGKVRATPSARRMARETGVDLAEIAGSGRMGRVQLEDVRKYATERKEQTSMKPEPQAMPAAPEPAKPAPQPVAVPAGAEGSFIPWKGMRKAIADRMTQSKREVPHVTLNATFDAREFVALREQLLPLVEERSGRHLSYTDLIVKALAVALKQHSRLNAHVLDDGIHELPQINVGIAVAVEDGLFVPVVRNVEQKGLAEITQEIKTLAEKARQGQLTPEDMSGGTISVSSLAHSRVESFNAIIRQPEAAILSVGRMRQEWAMDEAGKVFQKPVMTISLNFDHRAVDGAPAAAFLDTLIAILENPLLLMV